MNNQIKHKILKNIFIKNHKIQLTTSKNKTKNNINNINYQKPNITSSS